jgi:hypothetical protein
MNVRNCEQNFSILIRISEGLLYVVEWWEDWWMWKDLKGNFPGLGEILHQHILDGLRKATKYLRIAGAVAEIGTEHPLNTSLKCYLYSRLFR